MEFVGTENGGVFQLNRFPGEPKWMRFRIHGEVPHHAGVTNLADNSTRQHCREGNVRRMF